MKYLSKAKLFILISIFSIVGSINTAKASMPLYCGWIGYKHETFSWGILHKRDGEIIVDKFEVGVHSPYPVQDIAYCGCARMNLEEDQSDILKRLASFDHSGEKCENDDLFESDLFDSL